MFFIGLSVESRHGGIEPVESRHGGICPLAGLPVSPFSRLNTYIYEIDMKPRPAGLGSLGLLCSLC
jgi:hypothetical protein